MLNIEISKVEFEGNLLFENVLVNAPEYAITSITGISGSGKTTIINILTFQMNTFSHYHIFNTCLDNLSNEDKQRFLFNHIGTVYQEPVLIQDLTVLDHINLIKKIVKVYRDTTEIIAILNLNELLYKYPNELSGGERVRVSILLSLIKDPKILIFDEPTSALDAYYADKVIQLLDKLKQEGKIIIIASHDRKIIDISDKVYTISNNTVELERNNVKSSNKESFLCEKHLVPELNLKSFFKLFNRHKKKYKIIIFILTILCIGISAFSIEFNNIATDLQIKNINNISSNELIIYKPSGGYYENVGAENGEANEIIYSEEIDKINKLPYVEKIDWRVDLYMGSFISLADSPLYYKPTEKSKKELAQITITLPTGESKAAENNNLNFSTINTYFEDKNYDKQIASDFHQKGVYISQKLAKTFFDDFTNLKNCKLNFNLAVPIYNSDGKGWGTNDDGITYNQNLTSCEWVTVSVPIAGVLKSSSMGVVNYFDYAIYISQSEMAKYIEKYKAVSDRTVYIYGNDLNSCKASINERPKNNEEILATVNDKVWTPKNYSVFIDDITKMDEVVHEINKMGFNVSNEYFESSLVLDSIENIQKSIIYMSVSITTIILIAYIVIKITNRHEQMDINKYFITLGLTTKEVFKIKKSIYFNNFIILSSLTSVLVILLYVFVNYFIKIGYTKIQFSMFIVVISLSYIVEYVFPIFIEKWQLNHGSK